MPIHFFWVASHRMEATAGARMFPFASRAGIGWPWASQDARL